MKVAGAGPEAVELLAQIRKQQGGSQAEGLGGLGFGGSRGFGGVYGF